MSKWFVFDFYFLLFNKLMHVSITLTFNCLILSIYQICIDLKGKNLINVLKSSEIKTNAIILSNDWKISWYFRELKTPRGIDMLAVFTCFPRNDSQSR